MDNIEKKSREQVDVKDTTSNKFLTFIIGGEEFGIEISIVKEIINAFEITRVPHTPDYIKGIMNLRGDIIPVVDVRLRFLMEPCSYDDMTCIIVIEQKDYNIGLIVDHVKEVKYISEENILLPPSAKLKYVNQFVRSLGRAEDRMILLIETQKLLYDDVSA